MHKNENNKECTHDECPEWCYQNPDNWDFDNEIVILNLSDDTDRRNIEKKSIPGNRASSDHSEQLEKDDEQI